MYLKFNDSLNYHRIHGFVHTTARNGCDSTGNDCSLANAIEKEEFDQKKSPEDRGFR
jgi:hypothetical protein